MSRLNCAVRPTTNDRLRRSSLPFKASPTSPEVDRAAEEVLPETQLAIAGSTSIEPASPLGGLLPRPPGASNDRDAVLSEKPRSSGLLVRHGRSTASPVATFAAKNRITARAIDADFEAQLGQSAIEGTVCC